MGQKINGAGDMNLWSLYKAGFHVPSQVFDRAGLGINPGGLEEENGGKVYSMTGKGEGIYRSLIP